MSADFVQEKVPGFTKRIGDQTFHGSNNTIIILGTDRAAPGPAKVSDGLGHINAQGGGKDAGTFHVIAGRSSEDPNFKDDKSFIYLTMKSDVDKNLSTEMEKQASAVSAAVVKSDFVRIVARNDLKIVVNDDKKHYVFFDGSKMKIVFGDSVSVEIVDKKVTTTVGQNKSILTDKSVTVDVGRTKLSLDGSVIKLSSPTVHLTGGCERPWNDLFNNIIQAVQNHDHVTSVGPSGLALAGPSGAARINALTANLNSWKLSATE